MEEPPVKELAEVVGWLLDHPEDYNLILWLARNRPAPELLDAAGIAVASRFVQAAIVGNCSTCYFPTVWLPDERLFDWPSFSRHECASSSRAAAPRLPADPASRGHSGEFVP